VGFLGYRWYQNYATAKAATATTAATTTATGTGSTMTTYATLGAWENAAIAELVGQGMTGSDALNGITNWLNGTCVTAGVYQQVSQLITTVGLPPGYDSSNLPNLAVCPSATTPPPATTTPTTPLPVSQTEPVGYGDYYVGLSSTSGIQPAVPEAPAAPGYTGGIPGTAGYTGSGSTISTPSGPGGTSVTVGM
jgi:hypothetical protein